MFWVIMRLPVASKPLLGRVVTQKKEEFSSTTGLSWFKTTLDRVVTQKTEKFSSTTAKACDLARTFSSIFFSDNLAVYKIMWKKCHSARQVTDENKVRRMCFECLKNNARVQKHTLNG